MPKKTITVTVILLFLLFFFVLYKSKISKNHFDQIEFNENKNSINDKHKEIEAKNKIEKDKQNEILIRMLEHKNICYSIHVFVFKLNEKHLSEKYYKKRKLKRKTQFWVSNEINKNSNTMYESLAYIFLGLLIYSLVLATADISKQLKMDPDKNKNNFRKYSLQEYAKLKQNEKKQKGGAILKKFSNAFNNSTQIIGSLSKSQENQMTKSLKSEAKSFLRRSSVPVFSQAEPDPIGIFRRQSYDFFGTSDFNPEGKRRVRMIKRH